MGKITFFEFPARPTQTQIKKGKAYYLEKFGLKANKHAINQEGEKFLLSVWN